MTLTEIPKKKHSKWSACRHGQSEKERARKMDKNDMGGSAGDIPYPGPVQRKLLRELWYGLLGLLGRGIMAK